MNTTNAVHKCPRNCDSAATQVGLILFEVQCKYQPYTNIRTAGIAPTHKHYTRDTELWTQNIQSTYIIDPNTSTPRTSSLLLHPYSHPSTPGLSFFPFHFPPQPSSLPLPPPPPKSLTPHTPQNHSIAYPPPHPQGLGQHVMYAVEEQTLRVFSRTRRHLHPAPPCSVQKMEVAGLILDGQITRVGLGRRDWCGG